MNFRYNIRDILLLLLLPLVLIIGGCESTSKGKQGDSGSLISKVVNTQEGWVDENTYQMVVVGQWDRNRYYIEGVEKDEVGKIAKSSLGLESDAKEAAKVKAMRNFKEKMNSDIKSSTKVEDGILISDTIEAVLSGVIISPQAIREEYTSRHDARVLFQFQTEGLREYINKAAAQTLKKVRGK